ncbi:MAG: hypothetical protein M3541_21340 [Acidobacteriota bacterium]|nr:hypothetical protein [Acidobacteriota bacterium]MDQ3421281.1 hypothetical protein [Acidobacteriota bacterium]
MSLPAVTARLYSSDEVQYFSYLRSLYFDQDVSFENEYRYFYDRNIAQSGGFHETFLERETGAGRRVNYGTIGAAILWSPFYAIADLWTRVTSSHEANGFTAPYVRAVAYGSAFYGFLAVLLSIRTARLIGGKSGAFIAGLAVWLGTPLLFYMYVAPPFSHACSAFAVALFVNVWLHVRRSWTTRGALALGLCAALIAMVREQDFFLALGPAVDFAWSARREIQRFLVPATAGVAGTLLGFLPQLLAYNALNGYPGPAEHVQRKMYWYAPHGFQVLASPNHGLFFWTPLAILALAGLFFVRERIVAASLLIMVLSQVYVAGSVESWTVAGAFGQRRFVNLTVILVIGLTALWTAAAANRRTRFAPALAGAIALCAWWNVALMAQFAIRLMDRQQLDPARNAYHAFVTLPLSGPSLAYRYLTDRGSFYQSQPKQD